MKNHQPTTHERYLHAVRDVVTARARDRGTITADQAERLAHTKLLYGVVDGTYRGVTVFDAWENGVGRVDIVEVASAGSTSSRSRRPARSLGCNWPAPSSTTC
jgi:hypothetical protein